MPVLFYLFSYLINLFDKSGNVAFRPRHVIRAQTAETAFLLGFGRQFLNSLGRHAWA
jgi:hypothetical protein